MYESMNVWIYVCTLWKGVPYHLWAKNVASGGPPHIFSKSKKTCGGGIFHVVRWNISQKFLALPPPKYSRVKGGGCIFPAYLLYRPIFQGIFHGLFLAFAPFSSVFQGILYDFFWSLSYFPAVSLYSPRFAWGGRQHRRFISVRKRD